MLQGHSRPHQVGQLLGEQGQFAHANAVEPADRLVQARCPVRALRSHLNREPAQPNGVAGGFCGRRRIDGQALARTAEEALEAARRELGQDAAVLGTRTVPQRGWRGLFGARDFIVTAAAERVVSEDRPAGQELRHQSRVRMGAAHAQLCAAGFDPAVVDEIAAGLGNELRTASPDVVRRAIATWAGRISAPDDLEPAIEVFVGPEGAGKTTALLQVAAARAAKGARPVLVSTDPSQLGTVEPLRLHAALMGLRFIAARTAGQLEVS